MNFSRPQAPRPPQRQPSRHRLPLRTSFLAICLLPKLRKSRSCRVAAQISSFLSQTCAQRKNGFYSILTLQTKTNSYFQFLQSAVFWTKMGHRTRWCKFKHEVIRTKNSTIHKFLAIRNKSLSLLEIFVKIKRMLSLQVCFILRLAHIMGRYC